MGRALTAINKALKLAEGDKQDQALCYNFRAGLYNQLGDSAQTLDDINQTLRLQPKDPDYLVNRASFNMNHTQYDLAKVDLLRVPVIVKRAIAGTEKAMARSRKRAEKGLCSKEESEAFCAKSAAALKSYLDKQVELGVLTTAERKALGR